MKVGLINLTQHGVTIYSPNGRDVLLRFPPSGVVARFSASHESSGQLTVGSYIIGMRNLNISKDFFPLP